MGRTSVRILNHLCPASQNPNANKNLMAVPFCDFNVSKLIYELMSKLQVQNEKSVDFSRFQPKPAESC